MKNALNSIKVQAPATNAFDLSHDVKLSCNMGDLIPVLAMECLPGDRLRLGCENLIRLAPMLAPMMHRVDVRVEYFFVPNRLIWENWETWITNGGDQPDPEDPLPSHPYVRYSGTHILDPTVALWDDHTLLDYMGLPDPFQCPDDSEIEKVSALPFAAYQKIYDDYYRDENLIDSDDESFNLVDGNNGANKATLLKMRKRAWEADYFTKALPFAQKGEPVDVPLGDVQLKPTWYTDGDLPNLVGPAGHAAGAVTTAAIPTPGILANGVGPQAYDPDGSLTVGATTINDLRLAYRLQEWLEKNARGGTRYSELVRSHFNVTPKDARLQRAEYIVGVKNPIQISEVLNTAGDTAVQGNMSGHGVSYENGNYGKYYCTEHGYVIGILSIMPKTAYQQGIPRHFLKFNDPTELGWPTFANLGEQEIANREVMAFRGIIGNDAFGYMARYMEYKNLPSRVCGDFRTTLDYWHMGRIFDTGTPPALNQSFVEADPTKRIFAVDTSEEDSLYCQLMHHITCIRALPVYGTPTF